MISAAPPFALAAPGFPFRALAARAGVAPLGGEREVALACWMAARLAAGLLSQPPLPTATREGRAAAARVWFASLALPAATRIPFARVMQATEADDSAGVAAALERLLDVADTYLDSASELEVRRLAAALQA